MECTFKNQTVYYRAVHDKENTYTTISNQLIQDSRLTASEKGLMLMILSNSDKYILNRIHLERESKLTSTKFKEAWNNLKKNGYVERIDKKGYRIWCINELPSASQYSSTISASTNSTLANNMSTNSTSTKSTLTNSTDIDIINTNPPINNGINTNKLNSNITSKNITSEILDSDKIIDVMSNGIEIEKINSTSISVNQNHNSINFILNEYPDLLLGLDLTPNELAIYNDRLIATIVLASKFQSKDDWKPVYDTLKYDKRHYGGLLYAVKSALNLQIKHNIPNNLAKETLLIANINQDELLTLF